MSITEYVPRKLCSRFSTSRCLRTLFRSTTIAVLLIPALAVLIALASPQSSSVVALTHAIIHVTRIATVYRHPQTFPRPPYTLFSTKVLLPTHDVRFAYITIAATGKIQSVEKSVIAALFASNRFIIDVSPLLIMPGLIDPHVHVNEPGRASWEGFDHASRAAAAGGTTTILDMPLNNVPSTVTRETLGKKVQALHSATCIVDVGLIGGVIPQNIHTLPELAEAGVLALKSFMVDSQSKHFPHVSKQDLQRAIAQLHSVALRSEGSVRPLPYILHAELDLTQETDPPQQQGEYDHESYLHYEASRPASWETAAVRYAVETANNSNVHIHVAHVSSNDVLQFISALRRSGGLNLATVTAETCPHYLLWAKEEISRGATQFKCSPPIRSVSNRQELLTSTFSKTNAVPLVDLIASDHSPCPIEMKSLDGNMSHAWGGISGLQYRLQGSWTAASAVNASVVRLAELLAEGPAKAFGIDNLKGFLKPGLDADVVIWDPDAEEIPTEAQCEHRYNFSAYHGTKLRGVVFHTLLRGTSVFSRDRSTQASSRQFGARKGQLLVRSHYSGIVRSIDPSDWKDFARTQ